MRVAAATPARDCPHCPRLVAFRTRNAGAHPSYWNAPVPSFGVDAPALLIVGLAPGLHGANQTGRPFTGDGAGDVLYPALLVRGLADGAYGARTDDGLRLKNCRITNAVRCVPPENKPVGAEIKRCGDFLANEIAAMRPRAIFALGRIAHDAALRATGAKPSAARFAHAAEHALAGGATLVNSYHCSRYNMNTGRLTTAMFADALDRAAIAAGL